MHRRLLALLLPLLLVAGCDSGHHAQPAQRRAGTPAAVTGAGTAHCRVAAGRGRMGACSVEPRLLAPLSVPRTGRAYYGADVSNYQGCVTPRGLSFVFVKTGEGRSFTDRSGACTLARAKAIGVPAGSYYFFRTNVSAKLQADRFAAEPHGPLPGALDFETNDGGLSNQAACAAIRAFGAEYRQRTGLRVNVVYDAPGLWPGCSNVKGQVGWVADLSRGCRATLSGVDYMAVCQYSFTGPFGGDADLWLRGSPAALAAAAHGQAPAAHVVPKEAVRNCAELNKFRTRKAKQGVLHEYGKRRVRFLHHYFGKHHEGGKADYVCRFTATPNAIRRARP